MKDQEPIFITGKEWIKAERPSFVRRHKFKLIAAAVVVTLVIAGVCR